MARARSVYRCTECGHEHAKWVGRCEACGAWNAVAEEPVGGRGGGGAVGRAAGRHGRAVRRPPARLRDVATEPLARWRTGHRRVRLRARRRHRAGLDDPHRRRAGHRQVHAPAPGRGAAGDGGAARCSTPAARSRPTSSGSAPTGSPRTRARCTCWARPGSRRSSTPPSAVSADVVVIDSIQTVYTETLESAPGNVGQVRECAAQLMRFAKESGTAVFVVGHVTKGGGIAGPKTLEHIVDTVLYFEGEVTLDYRLLRATKNRFGSVDELGVFSMTEHGLVAVPNPSAVFLAARADGISGSAVTALMEGTRPVLVEVQALAAKAGYGTPQRVATGLDPKRLAVLLAVLERRAETSFAELDVFVQVTAGVRLTEPAPISRSPRRSLAASTTARAGRRRSSSARSASAARSGPAAPSSAGSPRRRGSASGGCSAPRGSTLAGSRRLAGRPRPRRAAGARACRVTSASSSSPRGGAPGSAATCPSSSSRSTACPMLLRALRPFASHPDVAQVVVVLRAGRRRAPARLPRAPRRRGLTIVAGGRGARATRCAAGLRRAPARLRDRAGARRRPAVRGPRG